MMVLGAGIVGFIIALVLFVAVMRRYMIIKHSINAPYDVVCDNIEKAVKSVPGWVHPMTDWNLHKAVSKTHCFDNIKNKRVFFICKAEYANAIVDEHHHMGAMMPCAWGVYETNNGDVYISKMNIGLMSLMFAGNIIGLNMGKVAKEEKLMFKELHRLVAEAQK
jgi:uncharacterized protein (DUF302 family)